MHTPASVTGHIIGSSYLASDSTDGAHGYQMKPVLSIVLGATVLHQKMTEIWKLIGKLQTQLQRKRRTAAESSCWQHRVQLSVLFTTSFAFPGLVAGACQCRGIIALILCFGWLTSPWCCRRLSALWIGRQCNPRLIHQCDGDYNPDTIAEHQINPQIEPVVSRQILASCQPLWSKCHPTYNTSHNTFIIKEPGANKFFGNWEKHMKMSHLQVFSGTYTVMVVWKHLSKRYHWIQTSTTWSNLPVDHSMPIYLPAKYNEKLRYCTDRAMFRVIVYFAKSLVVIVVSGMQLTIA